MSIKIGNQDISGIYLGDKEIAGVYLGDQVIWESSESGVLDNGNVTFKLQKGVLTFSGTGTIPVINSDTAPKLYNDGVLQPVNEIIVEDTITEIAKGAFEIFHILEKITLPFVGKNAKSEYITYPFGWIFGEAKSPLGNYYLVETYDRNPNFSFYREDKTYKLPSSLIEVILTGGQYNKTQLYENSFRNCVNIQKLVIPDNVTFIEDGALFHCKNLTTLTIPFIGRRIFSFSISPGPGRFSGQTFGNCFGRFSSKPSSSNDYKVIQVSWYAGYRVDDGVFSSYDSYASWSLMPTSLKNLIVTGGDVSWQAFGFIEGQLQTIKFISTNPNYPTKYICSGAFRDLGIQEGCKIYLPSSITAIGENQNSGTNNNSKIYFQGNSSQWNALKDNYISEYDSTGAFFNNWNVICNAKPEDIDTEEV